MPLYPYRGRLPSVAEDCYVAPTASIVGDVELGSRASVWFGAVLRGDRDVVRVGANTNVQDLALLHTDPGAPCIVEENCTIAHSAVVHGCRIGAGSLVGMGAIVLSRAQVGAQSLVGAGAVVAEGREFPPRSLILGIPGKLVRPLTDEEVEQLLSGRVKTYLGLASEYLASSRALDSPQ